MKARDLSRFSTELLAAQRVITYIPMSALVPEEWAIPFWARFSEDAPFTWGDNDGSLIRLSRFVEHAKKSVRVTKDIKPHRRKAYRAWMALLDTMCASRLEHMYVNLEVCS